MQAVAVGLTLQETVNLSEDTALGKAGGANEQQPLFPWTCHLVAPASVSSFFFIPSDFTFHIKVMNDYVKKSSFPLNTLL